MGEKFGGGGKRQTERKEAVTGRPPAMWALLLHTWARSLDAAFAVASGWGNYAAAADRPVGQWGRDVRILWALGDVERKPDDGPRGLSETHLSEGFGRVTGWWSHVPVTPSALLGCG